MLSASSTVLVRSLPLAKTPLPAVWFDYYNHLEGEWGRIKDHDLGACLTLGLWKFEKDASPQTRKGRKGYAESLNQISAPPLRSLRLRGESQTVLTNCLSLITQGVNGIERGRFPSRVVTKDDSHNH